MAFSLVGVAPVIGCEGEGLALPLADEGVAGEGGEERQLAAGAGRYAAHDEAQRGLRVVTDNGAAVNTVRLPAG
jgi:hypothetical protein